MKFTLTHLFGAVIMTKNFLNGQFLLLNKHDRENLQLFFPTLL